MKTEIQDWLKSTNLQYLWDKEGELFTSTTPHKMTTHGSLLGNEFIGCLQGSVEVPEGTKGLLFKSVDYVYDRYVRCDDMDFPAKGAKIVRSITYYSFVTIVTLRTGHRVLADCMKVIERTH